MSYSDREQIQQLMANYADSIDEKDYERIAGCFAIDATATYKGHSVNMQGRSEIKEHMIEALSKLDQTQHMFTNFLIDVQGDTARLKCDVLAQHVQRGAAGGDKYLAGGKYKIDLKRIDGDWKIIRVNAGSVWREGNRELLPTAG
jgi:uncharacterized protein (TIGR02246 family)